MTRQETDRRRMRFVLEDVAGTVASPALLDDLARSISRRCPYCDAPVADDPAAINGLRPTSGDGCEFCMWRGHATSLILYGLAVCREWTRRGFRDECAARIEATAAVLPPGLPPPWLGNSVFHRSHQSNLVRKNPEFYGPQFPGVPPDLPYVWPEAVW